MVKRIRVIAPIVPSSFRAPRDLSALAGNDTEISQVFLERGPASIESEFDEVLAMPDILQRIVEAEREGINAVVVSCMADPGIKAGREAVSIPVIGPAEAAMHLAAMLGHRFSIVTVLERVGSILENLARVYGVKEKLASVRSVEIPVLDLDRDRERLVEQLVAESTSAIVEDGAHVIIFGCTGMYGYADAVQRGLAARGFGDVPVIDPVPAAVRLGEALIGLGLSQSKRTYPRPPAKRIVGYDALAPVSQPS